MLFYTTIFVACLISAIAIPWLYRSISSAGKAVQRTILPSSEQGPTSHLETSPVRNGSTPFDLKNHHVPGMLLAREYAGRSKVEQKFAGANSYYGPRFIYSASTQAKVWTPNAGSIHRKDKPALLGNTYKVTRTVNPREKFSKIISKPSSWK
jgi:hypothetical protein